MYKLKLLTKWNIHDVFYRSLLEQDITKKELINNALPEPEKDLKFAFGDNREYEVKAIIDSVVYGQQANSSDQMPALYYLVL